MININDKVDATTTLTAAEYNDHKNCIQTAVTKSGQTLSVTDTPDQFARALFLNGVGASSFIDNSSSVNTIQLTPYTGLNGMVVADDYAQLDGAVVEFYKTSANTSTTVYVNIGQTTGTLLGGKLLVGINSGSLAVGDVLGYCRIKYVYANGNWELITSQTLFDTQITNTVNGVITAGEFIRGATIIVASSDSPANVKNGADYVISTSLDCGVVLNGIFTALTAAGGGTIYQCVGTYNQTTIINPTSNIIWKGDGVSTVIKRDSSTLGYQVTIASDSISNLLLEKLNIDGDSVIVTSGESGGIYGNDSAYRNIIIKDCLVHHQYNNSGNSRGIRGQYLDIENCKVYNCVNSYNNVNAQFIGIYNNYGVTQSCRIYSNSCSYGRAYGIYTDGGRIIASKCYSNSSYSTCYGASASASRVSDSDFYSNSSSNGAAAGLFNAESVINCQGYSNTGVQAWGFSDCKHMQQNKASGNTTSGYYQCYADSGSVYTVNNAPDGGFNT